MHKRGLIRTENNCQILAGHAVLLMVRAYLCDKEEEDSKQRQVPPINVLRQYHFDGGNLLGIVCFACVRNGPEGRRAGRAGAGSVVSLQIQIKIKIESNRRAGALKPTSNGPLTRSLMSGGAFASPFTPKSDSAAKGDKKGFCSNFKDFLL